MSTNFLHSISMHSISAGLPEAVGGGVPTATLGIPRSSGSSFLGFDLSDEEGGEDEGGSKPKKEEPEDLGIPNVAVGTPPPTASGNPADIECIDIE
jgi:hypothetical protein